MILPFSRLAALALPLLAAACAGEPKRATPPDQRTVDRLAAARVDPAAATRILNAHRAARGLGPVRLDPALTAMAQRQADAMVATNTMSHDAGGSFSARVSSAGLDTVRAAENISAGYYSTQAVMDGWRASPGHDANLLLPQATRFGIALAKDAGTTYGAWWALVIAGDRPPRQEMGTGPAGHFGSNVPAAR